MFEHFIFSIDLSKEPLWKKKAQNLRRAIYDQLPKRGQPTDITSFKDYLDVYLDRPFSMDPFLSILSNSFYVNAPVVEYPVFVQGLLNNYQWFYQVTQGERVMNEAEFDYTLSIFETEMNIIRSARKDGSGIEYTNAAAIMMMILWASKEKGAFLSGEAPALTYGGGQITVDCDTKLREYRVASSHKLLCEPDDIFVERIEKQATCLDVVIFNLTGLSKVEQAIRYHTSVARKARSLDVKRAVIVSDYALSSDFEEVCPGLFLVAYQ